MLDFLPIMGGSLIFRWLVVLRSGPECIVIDLESSPCESELDTSMLASLELRVL